jgi:hypothetical protein
VPGDRGEDWGEGFLISYVSNGGYNCNR